MMQHSTTLEPMRRTASKAPRPADAKKARERSRRLARRAAILYRHLSLLATPEA